ncbi:hypothetical protein HFP57_07470 [Parasphingopyxis algicola]|uniref:hypothetical protein n=1 Tax=Parasphingopyxis algicola TaxID=2026624 RepID=UPI0015A0A43B|nr:hypothetical protein [Parasphingopyxis algicola]QLC24882.1 hypothetical protein HFP57_07470 [Parasphingopyxis algicola]
MSSTPPSRSSADSGKFDEVLDISAGIARHTGQLCGAISDIDDNPGLQEIASCQTGRRRSASRIRQCDAGAVRSYLRARRNREAYFPNGLFGDPAWDLLLHLYVAQAEERDVSVSDACIATCVPPTTGLRWLTLLEQKALITRRRDHSDGRRFWVTITAEARKGINIWLDTMWPLTKLESN